MPLFRLCRFKALYGVIFLLVFTLSGKTPKRRVRACYGIVRHFLCYGWYCSCLWNFVFTFSTADKLPRSVCCSCFCHFREGAKMVCFCFSQKTLPLSFFFFLLSTTITTIYIDMDIDIGYLRLSLGYLLPLFRLSFGYLWVMFGLSWVIQQIR